MTAPRVSIVMPAYNAARTLKMTYADLPHDVVDMVIVVDDGIATGSTMVAAVRALRAAGAARVVVAAGVASREAVAQLGTEADEVVVVEVEHLQPLGFVFGAPELLFPIDVGNRELEFAGDVLGDELRPLAVLGQFQFVTVELLERSLRRIADAVLRRLEFVNCPLDSGEFVARDLDHGGRVGEGGMALQRILHDDRDEIVDALFKALQFQLEGGYGIVAHGAIMEPARSAGQRNTANGARRGP